MVKRKRKIVVLGSIIIALVGVLAVYISLAASGVIHSTVNSLAIKSADITKIYDGTELKNTKNYQIVSGKLFDGHHIVAHYSSSLTDVGQIPNEMKVEILDSNDKDVSREYNLTVSFGNLTVEKRKITIKTTSDYKEYDGTPLSKDEYHITSGSIVLGEEESVVCYGTITDIGTTDNECEVSIFNREKGTDVTSNYDINIELGTLEIGRRELNVVSDDIYKEYDGNVYEPVYLDYHHTKGELINPTHRLEFIPDFEKNCDVGSYSFTFFCKVYDEQGRDVSDSYKFNYTFGKIEIDKRVIEVKPFDKQKVYDTQPIYNEDYKILELGKDYRLLKDLVPGDELIISSAYSVEQILDTCDVGTYTIELQYQLNCADPDKAKNYQIDLKESTYTINKAPINIKSKDNSKIYDGKQYYDTLDWQLTDTEYYLEGDLYSSYVCVYSNLTEEELLNTKNKGNHLLKIRAVVYENDEVSENFEVNISEGTLVVVPYKTSISIANVIKYYDRNPVYETPNILLDKESYKLSNDILPDYSIEVRSKLSENDLEKTIPVGNYDLDAEAIVYNDKGEDDTSNFEISIVKGKLNVKPRLLSVSIGSKTKEYDSKPIYDTVSCLLNENEYEIKSKLLENTSISVYSSLSLDELDNTKNAGEYKLPAQVRVFFGEEDESQNYEFNINEGLLTVLKKKLTVSVHNQSKVYDNSSFYEAAGCVLSYNEYNVSSSTNTTVYDGESLVVTSTLNEQANANTKNAGTYTLTADAYITKDDTKSNNYSITVVPGKLTVARKELRVNVLNQAKEYNGLPYKADAQWTMLPTEYVLNTNLYSSERIVVKSTMNEDILASTKKANILPYELPATATVYENDLESTNYSIVVTSGLLTVTKKNLYVTVLDKRKEYDGMPIYNEVYRTLSSDEYKLSTDIYSSESIVVKSTLDSTSLQNTKNASDNYYSLTAQAFVYEGLEQSTNYNIIVIDGKLKVDKKDITVSIKNHSKVYDTNPFYPTEYVTIDSNDYKMSTTICDFETITVTSSLSYEDNQNTKNASENPYLLPATAVVKENGNTSNNYNITVVPGSLLVLKKSIIIQTLDKTKEYDGYPMFDSDYSFVKDFDYSLSDILYDTLEITLKSNVSESAPGVFENTVLTKIEGDAKYNYDFSFRYGEIKITKLDVFIALKDINYTYTGSTLLSVNDIISQSLYNIRCNNTDAQFTVYYDGETVKDVGQYEFIVGANIVLNEINITDYCDILQTSSIITVLKPLDITVPTVYKEYDGTPYYSQNEILDNSKLAFNGLLPGHTLNVKYTAEEYVEPGEYQIETNVQIISDVGSDVTDFYSINVSNGKIVIKYILDIIVENQVKTYDGQAIMSVGQVVNEGLTDDGLSYEVKYNGPEYTDVGNYNMMLVTKVYKDERDITSDCKISILNSSGLIPTMSILARKVSIYTASASKMTDGTPLSCKKVMLGNTFVDASEQIPVASGVLASEDKLIALSWSELTQTGQCSNYVLCKVEDASGNDVSENYKIFVQPGLLEIYELIFDRDELRISPVKQSVKWEPGKTSQNSVDPNGEILGLSEFINAGFVVERAQIVCRENGSDPGRYIISVDEETLILKLNGQDVTDRYRSIMVFETDYLYMYLYETTVYTNEIVKSAYDCPLYGGDAMSTGLASGHRIVTLNQAVLTRIGSCLNNPQYAIYDSNDEDVTHLYNIQEDFSNLKITSQQSITIDFNNLNFESDDNLISSDEYVIISDSEEFNNIVVINLNDGYTRDDLADSDITTEFVSIVIKTLVYGELVDVTSCYRISFTSTQ